METWHTHYPKSRTFPSIFLSATKSLAEFVHCRSFFWCWLLTCLIRQPGAGHWSHPLITPGHWYTRYFTLHPASWVASSITSVATVGQSLLLCGESIRSSTVNVGRLIQNGDYHGESMGDCEEWGQALLWLHSSRCVHGNASYSRLHDRFFALSPCAYGGDYYCDCQCVTYLNLHIDYLLTASRNPRSRTLVPLLVCCGEPNMWRSGRWDQQARSSHCGRRNQS